MGHRRVRSVAAHCSTAFLLALAIYLRPAQGVIKFRFDARPKRKDSKCENGVVHRRDHAKVHFIASVDGSSAVGPVGQEVVNTRTMGGGKPVEIVVGISQTGWDYALINLCVGDQLTMVIEPPDVPYGMESVSGTDRIPQGSSVKLQVEILASEPPPKNKARDYDSVIFQLADADNDKHLTPKEFLNYFKDNESDLGSEKYRHILRELEALFNELDQDGDRRLTLPEFSLHKTSIHATKHLKPSDEFEYYDQNNDGSLNQKEVTAFFKALNIKVPKDYWKHTDVNGDGKISFSEFTYSAFEGEDWLDEL